MTSPFYHDAPEEMEGSRPVIVYKPRGTAYIHHNSHHIYLLSYRVGQQQADQKRQLSVLPDLALEQKKVMSK